MLLLSNDIWRSGLLLFLKECWYTQKPCVEGEISRLVHGLSRLKYVQDLIIYQGLDFFFPIKKTIEKGWRDDLSIKITGCPSRVSGFNSYYPHSGSQLYVTSVLGDPTPPSGLCQNYLHMVHRHTCIHASKIQIQK